MDDNTLAKCLESLAETIGRGRVKASPLVRAFSVSGGTGLLNGMTCGKSFLASEDKRWLWDYFQTARSSDDIVSVTRRIAKTVDRRVHLAKSVQRMIQWRYLVDEKATTKSLLRASLEGIEQRPTLNSLYILPTLGCNFSCSHCFVTAKTPQRKTGSISVDALRLGIDVFYANLKTSLPPQIKLFGGEPLMMFGLLQEIVSHIKVRERENMRRNVQFEPTELVLFTNGSLIDSKVADWIFANDISVTISLDGRKKINDSVRRFHSGSGTFDSVMKGISCLKRLRYPFAVCMTIGKSNIDSAEKDVRWIFNAVSRNIVLNIMQDFIGARNSDVVGGRQIDKLTRVLGSIYAYLDRHGVMESKYGSLWNAFESDNPSVAYCAAHGGEVALMPDGSISPCHHLAYARDERIAPRRGMRILDTPLWKRWAGRTSRNLKVNNADCPYRLFCAGGCAVEALADGRTLYECAPNACRLTEFHITHMMEKYAGLYWK